METVLFVSGMVENLIEKLKSLIMEEYFGAGMRNLELGLTKMKEILETLKRELPRMEMGKNWVFKLKNICYDAEDMLDEVVTLFLRNKRDLNDDNTAPFQKVRLFFSNKVNLGLDAYGRVNKILERMNVVVQDLMQLKLRESENQKISKSKSKSKHVFSDEELGVVVGRDSDKDCVIDMLFDDCSSKNLIPVVSIVGMGGVGKSTLAKYVYHDPNVDREFQLKIWATVSSEFDATSVVAQIMHSVCGTAWGSMVDDFDGLRNQLGRKKFLLVLDDVWTESFEDWRVLRDLLPTPTPNGSKCLVTTRSVVAASSVGDGPVHELRGLSDADSWKLFESVAFASGKQVRDQRLVDIGKSIVSKCAGLPLALKTMGSLLHGRGLSTWFSFKNSDFVNISQADGILQSLKFSYNHLSPLLKNCFSYCALFPKDRYMDKESLIYLWMAQGFLSPANGHTPEDTGEDYFRALVQRSFFQDIKTDSLGGIISFKMHNLLHDLASSIAGTETFMANPFSSTLNEQTRHLSVVGAKDDSFFRTWLPGLKNVRTFLDFSLPIEIQQPIINNSFLSNARRLRALDVHNMSIYSLPDTAGQLLHLRYLDLSWNSELEVLPSSITQLYNLQTLKLAGCSNLKELPCDFRKLVNLRHLDILGCNKMSHMPPGFSTLTCLHTLTMFVVSQQSSASVPDQLEALKSLSNLKGSLTIKLQIGLPFDATKTRDAEYLKSMIHLKALTLRWGSTDTLHHDSCSDHDGLLEGLKPHCNLRSLKVVGFPGVALPSWAASSANLCYICLDDCPSLHDLPRLSQLPNLKGLVLHKLRNLEYMESDCSLSSDPRSRTAESPTFFPSLENLTLSYLPKVKGWWRVVGKGQEVEPYHNLADGSFDRLSLLYFPRLCQLEIMECPKLLSIPPCPQVEELNMYRFNAALQLILSTNLRQQQHLLRRRVTVDNVGYINRLPLECYQYISDISVHLSNLETLSPGKEVFSSSMCSLQSLQVTLCSRLKSLSGLGWKHLPSLQRLQLSNLPLLDLTSKSDDVEEDVTPWQSLHSLQILELDFLPKLVDLPKEIQYLTALKTLEIRSCHNLKALPEWISSLANLQSLRLEACTALTCLPDSIMHLTSLENLEVLRCSVCLREKFQNPTGEDWPKIMHIPHISIF